MANTNSEITIQVVFAVKYRENIITKKWRDDLHRYLTGIMKNEGLTPLACGGWLDHVHLLFGMPVTKNISDAVRIIKASSSKWINENHFVRGKFQWQEGYGAFSYETSSRPGLIKYIINQESHHSTKSFQEEYLDFLRQFEIPFNPDYLFDFKMA